MRKLGDCSQSENGKTSACSFFPYFLHAWRESRKEKGVNDSYLKDKDKRGRQKQRLWTNPFLFPLSPYFETLIGQEKGESWRLRWRSRDENLNVNKVSVPVIRISIWRSWGRKEKGGESLLHRHPNIMKQNKVEEQKTRTWTRKGTSSWEECRVSTSDENHFFPKKNFSQILIIIII